MNKSLEQTRDELANEAYEWAIDNGVEFGEETYATPSMVETASLRAFDAALRLSEERVKEFVNVLEVIQKDLCESWCFDNDHTYVCMDMITALSKFKDNK